VRTKCVDDLRQQLSRNGSFAGKPVGFRNVAVLKDALNAPTRDA
jgi:hypothetical protein